MNLRQRLSQPEILVAPGVSDALMARMVELAGFEAIYMTGAGVSHSTLGLPDLGLVSFAEMVNRATQIADAVPIPLIADADTGYGNALNVQRTVRAYERAGVAAMHLEDQTFPKRCGHFRGKSVVPKAEMVGKISAAVDARTRDEFVIIARTDARSVHGIDEAVDRARAYAEAGADMIFLESPETVEELRIAATCVDIPTMANMVEGGRTPLLPASELQELGFSLVIYPALINHTAARAVSMALSVLRETGDSRSLQDGMFSLDELNDILGLAELDRQASRYGSD
jgi:2,3-dimethylmalate lyase